MDFTFLRNPLRACWLALFAFPVLPLHAAQLDLFAGLFGKPLHISQDDIAGLKGKGITGYRVSALFAPMGKDWSVFCASLQSIAEKRLRMEGYEVVISHSIILDTTLPAICNIVVRKKGKMVYFSSLAINHADEGCFVTYELSTDT